MHVQFIDTQEKLLQLCQHFSKSDFLALDTEFIRQSTYYPILALLQICDGQQVAIIDPLVIKDLSPLMTLLYNKKITKVFHSARQDMEIFYYLNQSVPQPIFDTQIAAALLGYGEQIGYAPLVQQLLHINLDKSQTRTDWLKRPLSHKQMDYAANDVFYLAQLYPLQKKTLEDLGRGHWLDKDFQLLASDTTYCPTPEIMWKKVKGANKLKKQKLAILKNIAAFREQLAIQQNCPRRRVLSDDSLLTLAINPAHTFEELHKHYGLNHKFLQYNTSELLSLIQQGLNTPDKDCPKSPEYTKLSKNEEALAACLMAIVHLCASNNNISAHYLCSRKELDSLIKGKRDLDILSGWKNELIGRYLVQFLTGKAQLSYTSGALLLSNDTFKNNDNI
ncbi:MAG: ribonuclease D [Gammaproteobacteria bacterium]|nr:ribonuclease D [Gammaproteobacteria bacterium]